MIDKILVLEDDELHRKFLLETIAAAELDVGEIIDTADGEEAFQIARKNPPNAAILDLQTPGRSGVDVAKVIWAARVETPILFWSNYADEAFVRAIERIVPGDVTYGYLLKSNSQSRLIRTIEGVFKDRQTIVDHQVNSIQRAQNFDDVMLTSIEYEVLLDIAIGLTDSAIADYRGLSIRAVQNRLQGLYQKLGMTEVPMLKTGEAEFNRRNRAIALCIRSRKLNSKALETAEKDYLQKS